jgi:CO/xanthine dehydrogenase Mo-binding subunit
LAELELAESVSAVLVGVGTAKIAVVSPEVSGASAVKVFLSVVQAA